MRQNTHIMAKDPWPNLGLTLEPGATISMMIFAAAKTFFSPSFYILSLIHIGIEEILKLNIPSIENLKNIDSLEARVSQL